MVPDCSHPLYLDGEPQKFTVAPHGNRKANSTPAYVRTEESTKENLAKNVADVKLNTKRALFKTVKEVGRVSGAASTSSLPRNYTQAKNINQKLGLTPGSSTKGADGSAARTPQKYLSRFHKGSCLQ